MHYVVGKAFFTNYFKVTYPYSLGGVYTNDLVNTT